MFFAPLTHFFTVDSAGAIPILFLKEQDYKEWLYTLSSFQKAWLNSVNIEYEEEKLVILPTETGSIHGVIYMGDPEKDFWRLAKISQTLPPGRYRLQSQSLPATENLWCLAWVLAHYKFDKYKKEQKQGERLPQLVWPPHCDQKWVAACLEAITLVRDLINEPACSLTPFHLAKKTRNIAQHHNAQLKIIEGDELSQEYPCVHTVGKGAENKPYLLDLRWSHETPKKSIAFVGKGVCFDSGGLDLKPSSGMLLMKKDMGGAAHVLGLAHMVMALNLPVSLRVLIPAVENSISGSAMRPLDIIKTRKQTTVEIGNTDAEGRLILCDALYEAAQEQPDLLIDFATLTGAARIALGTDLAGFFCNDDVMASRLITVAETVQDPVWRLPLYQPYAKSLRGSVADLNNIGKSSYGGAITAALFLEHFITPKCPWIHIDIMAWSLSSSPGRPEGGEAMGLRAIWALMEDFVTTPEP